MRVVDSSAKVENVVNPPQIPVFKKRINFGFEIDPFEASMATRAIAMQPAMLIKDVDKKCFDGKQGSFTDGN